MKSRSDAGFWVLVFTLNPPRFWLNFRSGKRLPSFFLLIIWPAQQHGPKVICCLKVGVHRICANVRCLVQNVALHRSQSICACERALKAQQFHIQRVNREMIMMHYAVVPWGTRAVIAAIIPTHIRITREPIGVAVDACCAVALHA